MDRPTDAAGIETLIMIKGIWVKNLSPEFQAVSLAGRWTRLQARLHRDASNQQSSVFTISHLFNQEYLMLFLYKPLPQIHPRYSHHVLRNENLWDKAQPLPLYLLALRPPA
jgi:hypothetical protein